MIERLRQHSTAAALTLGGMVLVIAMVLGFEHIGGYIPCKLCLEQREPYYAAMPLALIAFVVALRGGPDRASRGLLALVGLLLLYSAYLAVYHVGVEWQWWAGPNDCGVAADGLSPNVSDLLADLSRTQPPACDEAAARFLGLSFAGWNVLASSGLALIALGGATHRSK